MARGLDAYALELAAASMHKAGDPFIYQLFQSDRWLQCHLSEPTREWSGYATDLSLAFESLHRDIQSGTSELREVVLRLVQLCVVRSTLASSENIPDGILLAAVQTAAWQSNRVTSTIARRADRDQQASTYISMLQADLDDAQRQTIQRALTALAFINPDEMPAGELLRGISFLDEKDQSPVADRLALCSMAPNGPLALWQSRGIGRKVLNAIEVVATMLVTPAARRPVLVKKAVDTLVLEAGRISRKAMAVYGGQPESPSSLDDILSSDQLEIIYGDYVGRPQVLSALEQAAALLSAYPNPGDLRSGIEECMGCVESPEEWSALSGAYATNLQAMGVQWRPPEYRQVARYESPLWRRDQDRLWWMRQIMIRSGHSENAHLRHDGEDLIGFLSIETVQGAWVQRALALLNRPGDPATPRPAASSEPSGAESDEVTTSESRGDLKDLLKRAIAPVAAAMAASMSGVPPEMIDELIPEVFDNENLMLQLFNLESVAARGQVDPVVARRTMGGLLCHALKEAYRAGGPAGAWADIDDELIAAADLTPVLDFVLSLPTDPERGLGADLFISHEIDVRDVPLLVVLEVVADHLDEESAVRVADALLEVRRTPVRNRGLDVLAPRLPREAIERILRLNWRPTDAREQWGALREIAAHCSPDTNIRGLIEDMALAAASGIEDGWAYVDAVLHTRSMEHFSAATAVANPEVLATVRQMATNDRTDALRGLSHHANRDATVPPAVFDEILALPGVNEGGTYSWRAVALISCASFLDTEMADRALDSAMELPERLNGGSSQAWGRDWTNEFIRAAVVNALVPALSRSAARRVFEYAKTLPYLAREPVFRTLAGTADRDLASYLFDHTVERYQAYLQLGDSEPPREIERIVSLEPPETFGMQRQVQTAELIAAIVDRLDRDRRAIAADLAMRFPATGPCAWLGSAILKHLDENDHVDSALLTSMALVDAYSYVGTDPSRIDILIDLLPHVQRHAAKYRTKLAEFIAARFPDFLQPFLDETHGEQLDRHDRAEYFRLTGLDRMPRPREEQGDNVPEADLRAQLAAWILSPAAQLSRDEVVKSLLLASPILSRVHALPRLAEVLPQEFCSAILTESIRQLIDVAHQLSGEDLVALTQATKQLPSSGRLLFIQLVTALPAFDDTSGDDVEGDAFDELYRDWGAILRPHPKYQPDARSIAAKEIGENIRAEQFRKSYSFMTPRVRFLAELAEDLPQDAVRHALPLLRDFPEVERAGALAALLSVADDSNARLIVAEIRALTARFAQLWALVRCQKELLEAGPDLTALAEAIVGSFITATSVGAAALMLIGYLGQDRAFEVILGQAQAVTDDEAKLKLISLAVRITEGPEHQAQLCRLLAQLSSPQAQYQATLMFSRAGIQLRDHLGESWDTMLPAIYLRLTELSRLPRTDFLRELSGEMSLVNALIDDSDRLTLARGIREVCSQWRWP